MLSIDLTGKTALITGSSGGIGRCIAKTLARCNANIIIHYYQNVNTAMEIKNECESFGVKAFIVNGNITEEQSVLNMKDIIKNEFILPDIIINNSVIQYEWTNVLEQNLQDYISQFNSCVLHNVLMAKAFVPFMIEKNFGRIIGINTECAMQCNENQSAYVSGKRGMDGVLKVLAKEVGKHNITVNQVAPGWVITDKEREKGIVKSDDYNREVPLKRRGEDQDIANTVAFLASNLADYITGAFIPVCGGHCISPI